MISCGHKDYEEDFYLSGFEPDKLRITFKCSDCDFKKVSIKTLTKKEQNDWWRRRDLFFRELDIDLFIEESGEKIKNKEPSISHKKIDIILKEASEKIKKLI